MRHLILVEILLGLALLCGFGSARAESLSEYAATCDRFVGGTVPTFNCLDGEIIPIRGDENGPCENPQTLTGQCWNYSRLGKLQSDNPDVEIRFLCRHYSKASGPDDSLFNDIAVIQHNRSTGATCFYQSPSGYSTQLNGSRVVAPSRGDLTIWQTPEVTVSQDCVACHDNGSGFIKTPFLAGVSEWNGIPSPTSVTQYSFPGKVTSQWRAYSVKSKAQSVCSLCHNMGASNVGSSSRGTSVDIGLQSAGLKTIEGLVANFAPWMPYGPASAAAHRDCANDHFAPDCTVTPFEAYDWDDSATILSNTGLHWSHTSATHIYIEAGQSLSRLNYQVAGANGVVSFSHGHPEDECSWDYPREENGEMVVTGDVPSEGRYTLNGKTLSSGSNVCRILLIATSGNQSIDLLLTINISK